MSIIYYFIHVLFVLIYRIQNSIYEFYNKQYMIHKNSSIGKDVRFIGKHVLYVHSSATIQIGDGFISRSGYKNHLKGAELSTITVTGGGNLKIGNNTGISCSSITCTHRIEIGSNTNIGAGCLIIDSNFHSSSWMDRFDRIKDKDHCPKPIVIGNNVFIGANCIVTKGVTIGDNSMVAAGSVVIKDIPKGELWGGNPAAYIKKTVGADV